MNLYSHTVLKKLEIIEKKMRQTNLRMFIYFLNILIACLLFACKGDIGSECVADAQCQSGQTCDLISEGGYCTLPDCREGECPGDSVCVIFENDDRYCMAKCQQSDDCRDGYICDKELGPDPFCRQN